MESTFEIVLTLLIALTVIGYLIYTLIKPEKF